MAKTKYNGPLDGRILKLNDYATGKCRDGDILLRVSTTTIGSSSAAYSVRLERREGRGLDPYDRSSYRIVGVTMSNNGSDTKLKEMPVPVSRVATFLRTERDDTQVMDLLKAYLDQQKESHAEAAPAG